LKNHKITNVGLGQAVSGALYIIRKTNNVLGGLHGFGFYMVFYAIESIESMEYEH
jgi:hypothetical protein